MRRKLDAIGGDELAHPIQVVQQLVLVKNCRWEVEVFAQKVPVELSDVAGFKRAIEWPQALINGVIAAMASIWMGCLSLNG